MFQRRTSKTNPSESHAPPAEMNLEDIVLPTGPNVPPSELWNYSWLFYGEKNWGKSTLAAQFPDVQAHFMFQVSRNDIRTPIIPKSDKNGKPLEPPLNWMRFKSYLDLILAKTKTPGRIIVDDLDLCARSVLTYHARLRGLQTLNGLEDNGKAWDSMKTDWENVWSNFLFSGWRVTFTSHARVRPKVVRGIARDNMKDAIKKGVVIPETQPTASGWAYDWSKVVTTFVGYGAWRGKERVLYLRGNERMHASAGGLADEHFLQKKGCDRSGEPYDFIPTGRNPKEAYKNLCLAWENKLEGGFVETETFIPLEE